MRLTLDRAVTAYIVVVLNQSHSIRSMTLLLVSSGSSLGASSLKPYLPSPPPYPIFGRIEREVQSCNSRRSRSFHSRYANSTIGLLSGWMMVFSRFMDSAVCSIVVIYWMLDPLVQTTSLSLMSLERSRRSVLFAAVLADSGKVWVSHRS